MMSLTVVEDGLIYTGFNPPRKVNGLVSLSGRVVYAGGRDEAWSIANKLSRALGVEPTVIELGGAIAIPGFVDAHLHFGSLGLTKYTLSLHEASNINELLSLLKEFALGTPSYWIIGRGWDQERLGRWPTRWDIDKVVSDRPVILIRVCGHAAVLNSRGLEVLGIVECGDMVECRGGKPTGIVYEDVVATALREAKKSIGSKDPLLAAQDILLSQGVTLVGDMGVDAFWLSGILSLRVDNALKLRVRVYLARELFEEFAKIGVIGTIGDEYVGIVGVKLFADGSLGARTARLSAPYNDDPDNRGKLLMDWKSIANTALRASKHGLDVAVHAIGDEALDHAIRGLISARTSGRIEHASVVRDDQLEALARYGLRIAVQPGFIASDWWIPQRLGDRAKLVYRFRSMLLHGITIGFSSDAPVEPARPLLAVYYAVTRPGLVKYNREERLDVATALELHTRGAALVLREENAGCLYQGCYADIAVLDADPLNVRIDDIPSIRVEATIIGGRRVYP